MTGFSPAFDWARRQVDGGILPTAVLDVATCAGVVRHSAPGLLERNVYGHGGWAGTEFWIYPGLDVCFVLLTNLASSGRRGSNADPLFNAVTAAR